MFIQSRPSRGLAVVRTRRLSILLVLASFALFFLVVACASEDPLVRARALQEANRFDESLPLLEGIVDAGTEDPEVLYRYGLALSRAAMPSRAIWPLNAAMESDEWLVPAALVVARNGSRTSNFEEAIAAATTVLEHEPDNEQALMVRAEARTRTRKDSDYELALEDANRILELNPDARRALIPRTTALLALERAEEAGESLEELAVAFGEEGLESPEASRFCVARATFAIEKREIAKAKGIYEKCLELYPGDPLVTDQAVDYFKQIGDQERATQIVREAYENDKRNRSLRISYARRMQVLGDDEAAEAILAEGVDVENDLERAQALWDLGNFHSDAERLEKAVENYEASLALIDESPSPQFLFDFADLLVRAEKFDRALEVASRIRIRSQREVITGRIHLARGDAAVALESLSDGLRLWPNNGVARYLAALAAEQTGDLDRAIEEYRYSIRATPGETDAGVRLARILWAEGRGNVALTILYQARGGNPMSFEDMLLEAEVLAARQPLPGPPERLQAYLTTPIALARAAAALGRGTWFRLGPKAAYDSMKAVRGIDLAAASSTPVLRVLVDTALAAGQGADVLELIDGLAARNESNAQLQAFRGLVLLASGEVNGARAAADAALAIAPTNGDALAVSMALAAKNDPETALEIYGRAEEAGLERYPEPTQSRLAREQARALVAANRTGEAISALDAYLKTQPLDALAVRDIAQLVRSEGDESRAAALTERSQRFNVLARRVEAARRRQAAAAQAAPAESAPSGS